MHDIICPHCGELFIGSDVAFDLSEYITPLLFDNPASQDRIRRFNFKFYADLDSFQKNGVDELNRDKNLFIDTRLGPSPTGPWYTYRITRSVLQKYIANRINYPLNYLKDFFSSTNNQEKIDKGDNILKTFYSLFGAVEGEVDSKNVISVLREIFQAVFSSNGNDKAVDLSIRVYCDKEEKNNSDLWIPDLLFVGGAKHPYSKICRNCGKTFPIQFGYYKMIPVVLLGSHFSGKTSYLCALKYWVDHNFTSKSISIRTLDRDEDLKVFNDQSAKYIAGERLDKTDIREDSIPILNLLVADKVIYSLIDWPGERFINKDDGNFLNEDASDAFMFQTRRAIQRARHIMFFLEPEQVSHGKAIRSTENVQYDLTALAARVRSHAANITRKSRFNSLSVIINKYDRLFPDSEKAGAALGMENEFKDYLDQTHDSSMYYGNSQNGGENSVWNMGEFQQLQENTKKYLRSVNAMEGLSGLECDMFKDKMYFLPVAPYGFTPKSSTGTTNGTSNSNAADTSNVNRANLVGTPFLNILRVDGII